MSDVAILEIPEVRARVSPITVAQYHDFPEFNERGRRTELIRGIVFEKMPKSPLHRTIATRLYRLILSALPHDFIAWKEEPLTLRDSEPEPDISVARGNENTFSARNATTAAIVIEIAITSASEDRALAALYAEAGVEEYWIVLPRERKIEVYRHPADGIYRELKVIEGEAILECCSVPEIRIALGELFA